MKPSARALSGRITVAGLAALALWLVADPPAGPSGGTLVRLAVGLACAAPLLLLLAAGARRDPRWGVWVAMVMVPYVTLGVGSLLATPGSRVARSLYAATCVVVFFAGIDTARRNRS